MKKKLSKKMMLSITAGALVTVAVIGAGTYAWFTGSAKVDASDFRTAKVALVAEEGSYNVYNFLTGHELNIGYQSELEADDDGTFLASWLASVNPDNQLMSDDYYAAQQDLTQYELDMETAKAAFDAAKEAWEITVARVGSVTSDIADLTMPTEPAAPKRSDYPHGRDGDRQYKSAITRYSSDLAKYRRELDEYNRTMKNLLRQLTAAEQEEVQANNLQEQLSDAYDAVLGALQDLVAKTTEFAVFVKTDANLVTPGSLIYGTYTLKNESNVPTYFRLAENDDDLNGIAIVKAVAFNGTSVYALTESSDGHYYSEHALEADTEITLVIGAYILGEANGNDVQETNFSFGGAEVELIQASNNAVYLDDNWNPDDVTFVDYTDPGQP